MSYFVNRDGPRRVVCGSCELSWRGVLLAFECVLARHIACSSEAVVSTGSCALNRRWCGNAVVLLPHGPTYQRVCLLLCRVCLLGKSGATSGFECSDTAG